MDSHRDFRSASKDTLRNRNSTFKWKYGSREDGTCAGRIGNEAEGGKVRPIGKYSDRALYPSRLRLQSNIVKPRCDHWLGPHPSRVRDVVYARAEVRDFLGRSSADRPTADMSASDSLGQTGSPDNFAYSFDQDDSPNQPMALDQFVKTNTRATERLVQKEYEILDLSGEALTGRKARSDLRKPAGLSLADMAREDDGFELL